MNLVLRHPGLIVLLNRSTEVEGLLLPLHEFFLANMSEFVICKWILVVDIAQDPYLMGASNIQKCRALESSLWELKVLYYS